MSLDREWNPYFLQLKIPLRDWKYGKLDITRFTLMPEIIGIGVKKLMDLYLCTLDADLHECPYLKRETLSCIRGEHCSFRQKKETREPYKREPRWYEKYYKK